MGGIEKFNMKIGVIGGGVMGTNHARILNDMGLLGCIVEPDSGSFDRLSQRFNNVPILRSVDDDTDSCAYVVATPSSTHFSIAEKLILQKKHLLIEKPVCTNTSDAIRLKNIIENNIVSVGLIERFNPILQYTKSWVLKNKVNVINTYRLSPQPSRIQDVGVIMDLGIHDIDAQIYLSGGNVKSVYASSIAPNKGNPEHYGKIIMNFDNSYIDKNLDNNNIDIDVQFRGR